MWFFLPFGVCVLWKMWSISQKFENTNNHYRELKFYHYHKNFLKYKSWFGSNYIFPFIVFVREMKGMILLLGYGAIMRPKRIFQTISFLSFIFRKIHLIGKLYQRRARIKVKCLLRQVREQRRDKWVVWPYVSSSTFARIAAKPSQRMSGVGTSRGVRNLTNFPGQRFWLNQLAKIYF